MTIFPPQSRWSLYASRLYVWMTNHGLLGEKEPSTRAWYQEFYATLSLNPVTWGRRVERQSMSLAEEAELSARHARHGHCIECPQNTRWK